MFGELEEEAREEFETIAERNGFERSHKWRWSFRSLKADVDTIATLDAGTPEGANSRWTVRQRTLVSHLRALRSLFRRIEAKRRIDEIKAGAGGK